ncbi:MAG: hypothetical protein LUH21_25140 [Clostridiales bacterium]|nr:hypothetical protein [Clostridiales bacterium]
MNIKLFPKAQLESLWKKTKANYINGVAPPPYVYDVASLYAANWLLTPATDILMFQSASTAEPMKL